jgi:hypothetical protein
MSTQNNLIWKKIPDYENFEISNIDVIKTGNFCKITKLIEIPMKNSIKKIDII